MIRQNQKSNDGDKAIAMREKKQFQFQFKAKEMLRNNDDNHRKAKDRELWEIDRPRSRDKDPSWVLIKMLIN